MYRYKPLAVGYKDIPLYLIIMYIYYVLLTLNIIIMLYNLLYIF